ncbi:MAG: Crp/Fnr family transcriptional regulator [Candidatus Levybacteria bacterium]|nr:Crp/Fnr family transcriptional regulator [Candidatus Levybacteria bacterium]
MTMSHNEYFNAVAKHPEYLVDLMYIFIDRLNYTERKLEGFIITDATARVANFLLNFVERFCPLRREASPPRLGEAGPDKKGGIILPVQLTHQRIAELVGSFRETVTIAMKKLEQEGIVQDKRGIVTVLDLPKLTSFASGRKKT